VHYELDPIPDVPDMLMGAPGLPSPQRPLSRPQRAEYCSDAELGEPQWIQCDIRTFKMDVLGQFGVIMADPPWDIHMELPYGTMADDEMRNLNVPFKLMASSFCGSQAVQWNLDVNGKPPLCSLFTSTCLFCSVSLY
jgi:hypothetical protein